MESSSTDSPRLVGFTKAITRLEEALNEPVNSLIRDACIQRFEFSFELAWKAVQEYLRQQGQNCQSPKSCLREAFKQGWITNEDAGLKLLGDRNLTSHTYDEDLAKAIYARLPEHLAFLKTLLSNLDG
jgi:nucleotidyltransferase substrate binding protein (TIGR01987 family)